MDSVAWSEEAYRIDEIPRKIALPCVVKITKGFPSEPGMKSLLDGDVIQINTEVQFQHIDADVLSDVRPEILLNIFRKNPKDGQGEWSIPLHCKGCFKVIHETKRYESVKELFRYFPRYAKLTTPLSVAKKNNQKTELPEGTTIELDRMFNRINDVDHLDTLVLSYETDGKSEFGFVSLKSEGHFISEQDHNEYTLVDIIERYRLPQLVTFTDTESKDKDATDDIAHVQKITATVHLKRLVSRRTLVGQYIRVRDVNDTQKSLVLIPLDNQVSRKTEVKVAQSREEIFDDTNTVKGSLYEDLDFMSEPCGIHAYEDLQRRFCPSISEEEPKAGQDIRESQRFYSGWKSRLKQALHLDSLRRKYTVNGDQKENVVMTSSSGTTKRDSSSVYEDVELGDSDENIDVKNEYKNVPNQPGCNQLGTIKSEHQQKQPGEISTKNQKPFKDLKVDELVDRLKACGFHSMAEICKEEHLDGEFFAHESNEFLRKGPFNLNPFEMKKFEKIKEGWIPKRS